MGALKRIIGAISDDVVAALAAGGYPPLTPDASGRPGKILIGTAENYEMSSPPRIIFEPLGSKFVAPEYASNSSDLDTEERRNQNALRTIAGEDIAFLVRCWGAANSDDAADDFDVTRALYHQVRASIHKLLPGAYEIEESGEFTKSSHINRSGREYTFGVTFLTPVLDGLIPYAAANYSPAETATEVESRYAPSNVQLVGTDRLQLPNGQDEPGCE